MLKIKTLSTKPKNSKLIKSIKDNGLTQAEIAQCLDITSGYFSDILNHHKLSKHDSNEIKKAITDLTKKRSSK